jgi:hypothetical protein
MNSSQIPTTFRNIISRLDPRGTLITLLLLSGFFVLLHLTFGWYFYINGDANARMLYSLFNLGLDRNVPTVFGTFLWFFAAAISWNIWRGSTSPRLKTGWLSVCLLATFFTLDESLMIHERLMGPFRTLVPDIAFLRFAWVIPYGVATILIALLLSRFLFSLPRKTMLLIGFAGTIFVIGALGFEMLGARLVAENKDQSIEYALLYTIEETMEMVGVSVFIYALLDYFRTISGRC